MSNVIALTYDRKQDIWYNEADLQEIRNLISTTPLTDIEFRTFVEIGRVTGLNPFLRELWAVKYGDKAAQIFIGRDGYRISARRHPDYEAHQVEAVYSDEKFKIINGVIHHECGFSETPAKDRKLLGAYCKVKRRHASDWTYVKVSMEEYNKKQSVWNEKPETMIRKVAEAQALRQAFPEIFNGTYHEAELDPPLKIIEGENKVQELNDVLEQKELESHDYLGEIERLIQEIELPEDRFDKALALFSVNSVEEMDEVQQEVFLNMLKKLKSKSRNNNV